MSSSLLTIGCVISSTSLDFAKAATRSSFFSLNALSQVEEIIRETISTSEPAIDKVPVGSVQPALFAGPEREVAPDFHIGGNQVTRRAGSRTGACDGVRQCVMVVCQTVAQTRLPVLGRNKTNAFRNQGL